MDKTDDDKGVDVADGSSILPTSTNDEVNSWNTEKERITGLVGYNTQGMKIYPESWYYSQREWDRTVGYGKVPAERLKRTRG